MPVKCSRIVLHLPVARGRALVFPARMPDSHRLSFAIIYFGPRVVRYRLNAHLPSPRGRQMKIYVKRRCTPPVEEKSASMGRGPSNGAPHASVMGVPAVAPQKRHW